VSDASPHVPRQRRESVRARVRVPVTVTTGGERLSGSTHDLSEGGAACALEARGAPPPVGTGLEVELALDRGRAWFSGVVLEAVVRPRAWVLTLRFVDPAERDQDLVRHHVFTALRRDRSRGFG
jgi:c-di-GMP-binding flagellar brake protein YcgR